ncbi:prepilin-type N-terminal cleavage/methylation domain-containing protein [Aquabacterium fontiphilum]|jgi:type IV fimbrial biogenesis protein FimT|uniref:GspH/FimT family pseudopilin n=1 Tax=Aquabacterium fontiphilum TaxID=450365 RepID=UPI001377BF96|nr:GspH/FimT family pseudopilin [Aquabacterium fontiphilum]NBD20603.1 prepilin-type N-terminal cleavage/methylation domain-containing protein [Aquabacterium fontiphilum]
MKTKTSTQRGVTLVELMITLAVLAIALSLAAPAMGRFLEQQATQSAIERFTGDLRFARSEALKRGQAVSLCVVGTPGANGPTCAARAGNRGFASGWLVFADFNANGVRDTGETVLREQEAAGSLVTSLLDAGNQRFITFQSTGVVHGGQGRLTLTPGSGNAHQRTLCMNLIGRVAIRPAGTNNC